MSPQPRYSRQQIARLLDVEEDFILALVEEHIVTPLDEPAAESFSAEACERIRIAHELVYELDINLPGAAVILTLRAQLEAMRRQFYDTLNLIREAAILAERRRGGR